MKKYKVAIIGGGPGGYVTAIRLQQYGVNVAIFEKERLGGVCLNHGCIPTKALVKVAETFSNIKKASEFGIDVENPKIEYDKVFQRKNKVVKKLVSGVEFIFRKRKINLIQEKVLQIKKESEKYVLETKESSYNVEYVIIATGSEPKELPFMKFDHQRILSSKSILQMQKIPKKLVVIGGGVIGCEFASIFNRLGVEVEIVEFLPQLINTEDLEISKRLLMAFKKSKIKVHLNTSVEEHVLRNDKIMLKLSNGKEISSDKVLVSVGRKPVFDIKTENFELKMNSDFIDINERMNTNIRNIYCLGDVTGKLMLAHTASKQGLIIADILNNKINNKKDNVISLKYENIPACTFTHPEVASVGLTERQAKDKYGKLLTGKFPFTANGKALGLGETFGLVKTIADEQTHKILGIHIIGPQATELIAQAGVLLGRSTTFDDAKKIIFAHPTLSEAVMESLEDLENLAIHKL